MNFGVSPDMIKDDFSRLEQRVIALENALASLRSRRARESTYALSLGGALVLSVGLLGGAVQGPRPSGPLTLKPPLIILDQNGQPAVTIGAVQGKGGFVDVYNAQSQVVATLRAMPSGNGGVAVYSASDGSQPKAFLNVGSQGSGNLVIEGLNGTATNIGANGLLLANGDNKIVASITRDSGGILRILNEDQTPNVKITGSDSGGKVELFSATVGRTLEIAASELGGGALKIFSDGIEKARIGVTSTKAGLLRLHGASGQRALAGVGDGQLFARNGAGVEALTLGIDNANQGYVAAHGLNGSLAASMSAGSDGTGMMQVFRQGSLSAVMGTKDGNKGDLCVNGPKATACVSVLAIKSFLPW